MHAILRCAKVSQTKSFVWFANLSAFFCTWSDTLNWPYRTDPSTQPHIQESDALVACRLNFSHFCFPFREYALWNEVPSRPFVLCNLIDQPGLNHGVWLFLNICNCSLPEFFGPPKNNLANPSPEPSWILLLYFNVDFLSSRFLPPTPPICPCVSAVYLCRRHSWFSCIFYSRPYILYCGCVHSFVL